MLGGVVMQILRQVKAMQMTSSLPGAGGAIPPSAVLIFKIKLLGVLPAGPARG